MLTGSRGSVGTHKHTHTHASHSAWDTRFAISGLGCLGQGGPEKAPGWPEEGERYRVEPGSLVGLVLGHLPHAEALRNLGEVPPWEASDPTADSSPLISQLVD